MPHFNSGRYGSQDAEEEVKVLAFPPVLHLHLTRFRYDSSKNVEEKFNDRLEFEERINLYEYVQRACPNNPENYTLHSVLVHSGDKPWEGHYVVFINPKGDGNWCKFDDDVVSQCTKQEAIDNNFGGACMLVYIRDSELRNILEEVPASDTSPRFNDPQNVEDDMTVKVLLEDSFHGHQGYDLYDSKKAHFTSLHIDKDASIEELIKMLVDAFNYSAEQLRPWPFCFRSDHSFRPSYLDLESILPKNVAEAAKNQDPWYIFLEVSTQNTAFHKVDDILLFFKLYDPKKKKIHYFGHTYMSINSKVNELIPVLNSRAGFPQDTELVLYEENAQYTIEKINDQSEHLAEVLREFTDGTILIFEKRERVHSDLPTCVDYFRYMNNRIQLDFINKCNLNDEGFLMMEMSRNTSYDQLAWEVAQKIDTEPYSLLFFRCQRHEDIPGSFVSPGCERGLKNFIVNLKPNDPKKIFYKNLSVIRKNIDKKGFSCVYLSPSLEEEKEFFLHFDETGTIADFLELVKKYIQLTEGRTGNLRLMEVNCNKVTMGPKDVTPLESLVNKNTWRIEDISEMEEDQLLICCFYFHRKMFSTFDKPFLIKMVQGEPFTNVKERIRTKMVVSEEEWRTFIFAIVFMGVAHFINEKKYAVNFADFSLPTDHSKTFDYFIAVMVDPSGRNVHSDALQCNANEFSFPSLNELGRDFDETASKPIKTTVEKLIAEFNSKLSALQGEISMLKTKISVMERDNKTKDSLIMTLRGEKPPNMDSLPDPNVNVDSNIGRIPRNYRL